MQVYPFVLTPGGGTAGTASATSQWPIHGLVKLIRCPGTALGGTADYLVTEGTSGGTILTLTDTASPWTYAPGPTLNSISGGTMTPSLTGEGYPVAGYVTATVAQGAAGNSGTIYLYYC